MTRTKFESINSGKSVIARDVICDETNFLILRPREKEITVDSSNNQASVSDCWWKSGENSEANKSESIPCNKSKFYDLKFQNQTKEQNSVNSNLYQMPNNSKRSLQNNLQIRPLQNELGRSERIKTRVE